MDTYKSKIFRWQHGIVGLIAILFLAFLLPSQTRAASPIEMIPVPNSGFEQNLIAGKIPSWSAFGVASSLSLSDTTVFAGSRSLKMSKPSTGGLGAESTKLAVTAGQSYEANIKLYLENYSGGTPGLWIRWYNAAGQFMNKQATFYLTNPALNTWLDVRVSGTAPDGAAYATIFPYAASSVLMTAYVDEVQFYRIDPNEVSVNNPGFEEAASGALIPGWELYPGTPTSAVSITSAQKKSGISSLRLDDTFVDKPVGLSTQAIGIHPNGRYEAKASVYLVSGGAVNLYIKFYDGADKEVGTTSRSFSTPLNTWSDVLKVEGIAPESAVKAKVLLYSGVGTLSNVYWDDISFTYKGEALVMPFAFENAINLGKATLTTTTLGGAIGNGELYFVTNGNPGTFYAIDAATGEINSQISVPGTTETWAVTVGADNNVYFAATANRNFWKFDTRPGYRNITLIGSNPVDNFVWDLDASTDGIIYGSTSPNAKVFAYDTNTQKFTDLGRMYDTEQYARGAGVTDQYLYVGIGSKKHLIRMDRSTGVKTEITMPFTGMDDFVHNITPYNGLLYVTHGTSLVVVNEQTQSVLKSVPFDSPEAYDGKISPPSPYNANLLYYRNKVSNNLWSYQVSTNTVQQVTLPNTLPEKGTKAFGWVTLSSGEQALATLYEDGKYTLYNPNDNSIQLIQVPLAREGVNIQSMAAGPDKKLYLGGFIDGLSVFNQETQSYDLQVSSPYSPHQVEEIGFLNGKTYFGAYGGARIYAYDATQPYQYGSTPTSNPKLVYTIPNIQDRPYAFTSGDNRLFIGTVPGYGNLGGSLTIYNETTGSWQSTRNVVTDQSIISLAYKNGILFGGTSIEGGLGSIPTTSHAKLFKWDVNTNTKLNEFEPTIPGLSSPRLFGGLSFGPDGLLWGIAWGTGVDGTNIYAIYALNPSTLEVVKSQLMFSNANGGSTWRGFYLRWGQDGLLYTTIARNITVFDPNTLNYRTLSDTQTNLMDIGIDGSIYYTSGPNLYKLPVRIAQASITMDHITLTEGTSEPILASGLLENGLPAILAGSTLTYTSSDPTVLTIVNGQVKAIKEGTASVYADITLNGKTKRSNTISLTVQAIPPSADLSSISLSSGPLNESFSREATSYTQSVAAGVSAISVTASVYDTAYATVTASVYNSSNSLVLGPLSLTSGLASSSLPLNTGDNTIKLIVTARDGSTKAYTVLVKRALSGNETPPATSVKVELKDSTGQPLSGGVVSYYDGGWKEFGVTDTSGAVSKPLSNKSYTFAIIYEGTRNELTQNTGTSSTITFQTVNTQVQFTNSQGLPQAEGTVSYYGGGWRTFGSISAGAANKELLAGSYTFAINYDGAVNQKVQHIGTDPLLVFQTVQVKVNLKNSLGTPLSGGSISYYAGSWKSLGMTDIAGEAGKEMLANSYTFAMNYEGTLNQRVQQVGTDPTVAFQTIRVNAQLKDAQGNPLDGAISYYGGSWRAFGATTSGEANKELLAGTYALSAITGGIRKEIIANTVTDPTVVFQY
ncbi:cadherin-like beta sandwich domain-containing protein [Paenibacillus qinlingensis]|uniref:cadherin-like beta sandwich domain-containing protein n=1 Tax=Paenibacillus qinlingensis TaxID=1837343 RepID=UPI0015643C11|nr:cadherin-like beta sandwich domain-containing protein [Paenibacillus qinlingensis]NQX58122.1 cadherin-like beta sandwich domain-containing protein [Paenibacillus qinlingensis]